MTLSPLQRVWFANLAANGAEQLALAALPLMAALQMQADAAQMGLLSAAQSLPFLLLSVFAGYWADLWPRAALMAGAEALRGVVLLGLPVCLALNLLTVPGLAAVGFLLASCTVMFTLATQAFLPRLVTREELASANARIELTRAAAVFLGPGIAGVVAGVAAPGNALAISGVISLSAAWVMRSRSLPPETVLPAALPMRHALLEGFEVVWRQPMLRAIVACAMVWNFSWFVLMAVFVLFALQALSLSPAEIGFTLGAQGLGMMLAGLALPAIYRQVALGWMIVIGPALSFAAAAILGLSVGLGRGEAAAACLAVFFLFGFGPMLWTIGQTTLRQAVVAPALMGRVGAVQQVATAGLRPLGALAGGGIAAEFGLTAAIWLAVAGFILQFLVILLSPIPRLRHLPEAMA